MGPWNHLGVVSVGFKGFQRQGEVQLSSGAVKMLELFSSTPFFVHTHWTFLKDRRIPHTTCITLDNCVLLSLEEGQGLVLRFNFAVFWLGFPHRQLGGGFTALGLVPFDSFAC